MSRLHISMAVHFCSQPTITTNGYHVTYELNKSAGSITLHTVSRWMSWKRLCDIGDRKSARGCVLWELQKACSYTLWPLNPFHLTTIRFYILTQSHGLSFLSLHTILLSGSAFLRMTPLPKTIINVMTDMLWKPKIRTEPIFQGREYLPFGETHEVISDPDRFSLI